jgi:HSP20 family protein
MYESMLNFPGSLFGELERLQRHFDEALGAPFRAASIRSVAPGTFPAINVGNTPTSMEIYAFAPGLDASKTEVTLDRGVLWLAGERTDELPEQADGQQVYSRERTTGAFRRAISLPDDIDPARVTADYRDGVLHVSIARREEAQPKRITVQ